MKSLRVAVVGCGRMGAERALAAHGLGAHVTFVCDVDQSRATNLSAQLPDCTAIGDPRELDWSRVDAIFVCTPPASRVHVECVAIQRGIPVFVEKPIGLSAEHVKPILAALEARHVLTAVGYMNRYRPSVQRARALIQSTTVLAVSADWLVGSYAVPWWLDATKSGGPINEQATHIIDLARYLVGDIDAVNAIATGLPGHANVPGTATFGMQFVTGQPFSFLYSCQATAKMIRFAVYASDRVIELAGWDFRLCGDAEDISAREAAQPRNAIFQNEVAAFLIAIAGDKPELIQSDFHDAVKTQRTVDALVRAAQPVATSA
jgi:myo-inositol 2-dehydrogenase / D-chiro-inositol 1-dehydrogenase